MPCFVYFRKGGGCWLRTWCDSNGGCETGIPGEESYLFDTYISAPPSPVPAADHVTGFTLHPHYNCYPGHGGEGDQTPAGTSLQPPQCAALAKEHAMPCFVYFRKGGGCWLRTWCDPHGGCETGAPEEESYFFDTYISITPASPSPVPTADYVTGFTLHPHYNCYPGHGGEGDLTAVATSLSSTQCAALAQEHAMPCFVYFRKDGGCWLRAWCDSHGGCETGVLGEDSYLFNTYISIAEPQKTCEEWKVVRRRSQENMCSCRRRREGASATGLYSCVGDRIVMSGPSPMSSPTVPHGGNVRTGYHQTSPKVCKAIVAGNFRAGSGGWCSGAIYFATTPEATSTKAVAASSHEGCMIKAQIDMGRVYHAGKKCDGMNYWKLTKNGYDSISFNPGDGEELVVFDPSRVISKHIIPYKPQWAVKYHTNKPR